MGFYEQAVLPRVIDRLGNLKPVRPFRKQVVEGLRGDVVEVGFGSGLNLPYLPSSVDRLHAVDPSATARGLARDRIARCPVPVDFVGLDGQELPLPSESADAVLCTFTLCTIPDASRALEEIRRVLRPGGSLHFLEHGLSPNPRVAQWQHRLTPLQRRVFGGCHLDRRIDTLIAGCLEITAIGNPVIRPTTHGYFYLGTARKV